MSNTGVSKLFRRFGSRRAALGWLATLRRAGREIRPTMLLALPIMSGMLAHMLIGLADTIMVGRVGVVPLAASAFVTAMTHLPLVFGIGMLTAVSVLTSQAFGADQRREAGEILRHGLLVATLTGILTVVGAVCVRPHLHRFGQPPEVAAAAGPYLTLFGCSLLPALLAHACKQFSEALNCPWIPNLILLGGVLLNVLLNWILIYGNWGAPALGLEGAGWATLIARTVMALALVTYVIQAPVLRPFQPPRWWMPLSKQRLQKMLRVGWPVGLQHLMEVSAFVFAALMMGWVSIEAIAAHQIAITCAATTFMFALGIGMATSIRVGQAWGASRYIRMRRIGFIGTALAAGIMSIFAIIFVAAGPSIASHFVSVPAVVALASQMLWVAAAFQIADGVQIGAISALRGLGDVRVPALIAILAYWMIAVPLGYVLGFPGRHGAVGIWIGLAVGLGAAAVALTCRFHYLTRGCGVQEIATHSWHGVFRADEARATSISRSGSVRSEQRSPREKELPPDGLR